MALTDAQLFGEENAEHQRESPEGDASASSDDEEPLYEVDSVRDMRGSGKGSEVLVRWVDYSEEYDTWEPLDYIEEVAGTAVAVYREKQKEGIDSEHLQVETVPTKAAAATAKKKKKKKEGEEVEIAATKSVQKRHRITATEKKVTKKPKRDDDIPFQVGDVVWGRTKGYKWWPGQIEELLDGKVLVAYLGEAESDDELSLMAVRPWNHPKAEEMLTIGRNAAIGPKVPGALPAGFERAHAAALMRRQ